MTEPLQHRVIAAIGDQYEIGGEIGRGAMAVVYRARDRRLKRPVAIKVLPPELAYDQAIRSRFTREAQTSAHLAHPHIVPIYDVGEREGIAYFVMALVEGGTLGALLASEPRQPIDEVRRLLCEIADALGYAHTRGVIHRDIKPDNILLDAESGRATVTDFGIARAMEAGTRLTLTGNSVGTPAYMSPEQAMGEREVDGRSDVYSLGVLAYQMLTGRVPFTAGNPMALLLKHVSERPVPISELRPETPRPLQEAVERAMTKSAEDRWPTAMALREALTADRPPVAAWRGEQRESSRRDVPHGDDDRDHDGGAPAVLPSRAVATSAPARSDATHDQQAPRGPDTGAMAPHFELPHLAGLTPAQKEDLRLWHGRVSLLDRLKATRRYAAATLVMTVGAIPAFVGGVSEMPPLLLVPALSVYMNRKLWRRRRSLHETGLQLRRVLLSWRARNVLAVPSPDPAPPPPGRRQKLEKLAPPAMLESPEGAVVRSAAEDRATIREIFRKLPRSDRSRLPDVVPTADALVDRVSHLATLIQRLDESMDRRGLEQLDARIARMENDRDTPEGTRRLELLLRQRESLTELIEHRAMLVRQLESAGLALGNLRLDLIKFRSSGLQSAHSDLSTATQEARSLSLDIGAALEAADEVRHL